ncbi:MAG: hypothetical protein KGS48_13470 [Bacteroidetes bacterium]|nr:hypothetical protein [Bacteroidota bacterium]
MQSAFVGPPALRYFCQKFNIMRVHHLFLGILIFSMAACSNNQHIQQLQEQTEAVHDEAMKDLATLNRLSRSLKKAYAELDSVSNETLKAQMGKAVEQMDKAESEMMEWMAQYRSPEGKPASEAKVYLENELSKISKNRDDIRNAIQAAQALQNSGK